MRALRAVSAHDASGDVGSDICMRIDDLADIIEERSRVKLFQAFEELIAAGADTLLIAVYNGKCGTYTVDIWVSMYPNVAEEETVCIRGIVLRCHEPGCLKGAKLEDLERLRELVDEVKVVASGPGEGGMLVVSRFRRHAHAAVNPQTLLLVIPRMLNIVGCEGSISPVLHLIDYVVALTGGEHHG